MNMPQSRFVMWGRVACVLGALASAALPVLAVPVIGTVGVDSTTRAGADGQGRVLLFSPNPVQPGSSISHWDTTAVPDLLMEPNASSTLPFPGLDLTRFQMQDIGWPVGTSNIAVRYMDSPGQGFNDPSLGASRRQAIEFALSVWSGVLRSSVTINVDVSFSSLDCSNGSGVLAQAGPQFVFENFPGAPVGGTLFPGALAESLSGQNLSLQDSSDPNAGDLSLDFNSRIDQACLGSGTRFYYGLDGNEPGGTVNFVLVALHELAHGLGFSTFVNEQTGALFLGRPDIFARFILDNTNGLRWHEMTSGQRVASAVNTGHLVWSGNRVTTNAPSFLQQAPALIISSPSSLAGLIPIATAQFGPPVSSPGISGELVLAVDGSTTPSLACSPIVNTGTVSGRIAVVDRGTCNFTVKVRNAQDAGARAVVVINNQPGAPIPLGGDDGSIAIVSVMVSQADGQRIKTALASTPPPPPPDLPGSFSLADTTLSVAESEGTVSFDVVRSGGSNGAVSVTYATADGTAKAGQDYVAASGTVTFANGETGSRRIDLTILDDQDSEDVESFTVTLSNPQGGASLGSARTATVTLEDDEPCESSPTVICLNQGRFKVRVTWRDFESNRGDGTRFPIDSPDSALFWFFTPANWEMLVKVLDGCSFNDRYWVFAAATTNVEYTLTVTDTLRGRTRQYLNPLGVSSPAVTDTDAFATCP